MDSRDYFNRKVLIDLDMKYQLAMLDYEDKQCYYDNNAETFNDQQKKIQKLYVTKQKNLVEIAKMDIEIFKSNNNIK